MPPPRRTRIAGQNGEPFRAAAASLDEGEKRIILRDAERLRARPADAERKAERLAEYAGFACLRGIKRQRRASHCGVSRERQPRFATAINRPHFQRHLAARAEERRPRADARAPPFSRREERRNLPADLARHIIRRRHARYDVPVRVLRRELAEDAALPLDFRWLQLRRPRPCDFRRRVEGDGEMWLWQKPAQHFCKAHARREPVAALVHEDVVEPTVEHHERAASNRRSHAQPPAHELIRHVVGHLRDAPECASRLLPVRICNWRSLPFAALEDHRAEVKILHIAEALAHSQSFELRRFPRAIHAQNRHAQPRVIHHAPRHPPRLAQHQRRAVAVARTHPRIELRPLGSRARKPRFRAAQVRTQQPSKLRLRAFAVQLPQLSQPRHERLWGFIFPENFRQHVDEFRRRSRDKKTAQRSPPRQQNLVRQEEATVFYIVRAHVELQEIRWVRCIHQHRVAGEDLMPQFLRDQPAVPFRQLVLQHPHFRAVAFTHRVIHVARHHLRQLLVAVKNHRWDAALLEFREEKLEKFRR